MLIYDRRRCRPLPDAELRRRLTLTQRAKLAWLESTGWRLLFLRGEPASAFVQHDDTGYAAITREGRVLSLRNLTQRPDEATLPPLGPIAGSARAA
ncbi:hypothetical protein [Cognatilysobacter segetis]|uniref:hypothetical protein n=1 Tax=Cognatilysobacter segetis TaxID=2492394 RepID=UPI0010601B72|nr:hypothetical protein [Lysobacter segetis]